MSRISNRVITGLNVLAILLSLTAIGFSLWFHVRPESTCQKFLKTPLLIMGAAVLVVAVAGLVGACCRVSFIMWLYLVMLFVLVLGLIFLTAFTIMVTNKGVGKAFSGRGMGDHRLGDYSRWLQKYVINAENWDEIKSCLAGVKLCQMIQGGKGEDYYKHDMPPIMSGCCKPPAYCGLEFHNATYWTMPKAGPAMPDPDCKKWSNVQEELCFDCDACKKAVLENVRREWRLLALINICIIAFVIIVYSIGCCALRNNRHADHKQKGHP